HERQQDRLGDRDGSVAALVHPVLRVLCDLLADLRRGEPLGHRGSVPPAPATRRCYERRMCRWMAYSGSPLLLERLLYTPVHSLIDQSLHSQLGVETTNGDGFGIGWYGEEDEPALFKSVEPAWNDQNLRELGGHVRSSMVFAHIRASTGTPVQWTNC